MIKPVRIQLRRMRGWRLQSISERINGLPAVKVDRSGPWGNPFRANGSKQCVVDAFRDWARRENTTDAWEYVRKARSELRGKNLACWCKPDAKCHADVLLEIANQDDP